MGSTPVRADEAAPATAGAAGRLAALGGVVGPVAFIVAWVAASAIAPAHSAMDDAISELAAVGADTRALMTSGFVIFALCVLAYAMALRSTLGGGAWIAAAGMGFATLLVAAIPLGRSEAADHGHGIVAVCGYALLAITPLLAMRPLVARGQRRAGAPQRRRGSRVGDRPVAQRSDPADRLVPTDRPHRRAGLDRGVGSRHGPRAAAAGPRAG